MAEKEISRIAQLYSYNDWKAKIFCKEIDLCSLLNISVLKSFFGGVIIKISKKLLMNVTKIMCILCGFFFLKQETIQQSKAMRDLFH
jgi:hypothetical protein